MLRCILVVNLPQYHSSQSITSGGISIKMYPRGQFAKISFFTEYNLWGASALRGQGASEVDVHFFIVPYRKECQLSETFFGMKKYCS